MGLRGGGRLRGEGGDAGLKAGGCSARILRPGPEPVNNALLPLNSYLAALRQALPTAGWEHGRPRSEEAVQRHCGRRIASVNANRGASAGTTTASPSSSGSGGG